VIVLFVGTAAIKATGPLAGGAMAGSGRRRRLTALVAPALLAGLVVYETFRADAHSVRLDARAAGLAFAAIGLGARLPLTIVIFGAAATAALVRAVS
jgi:hypothetical protein